MFAMNSLKNGGFYKALQDITYDVQWEIQEILWISDGLIPEASQIQLEVLFFFRLEGFCCGTSETVGRQQIKLPDFFWNTLDNG